MNTGTFVYQQGDRSTCLYYLHAGCLKQIASDRGGRVIIHALLRPGDFFGAIPGAAETQMHSSMISKSRSRLYRCRSDEFAALLDEAPTLARYLLSNLSDRLGFAQRQAQALRGESVEARLARTLYALAGRHGGHCRHGHEVDIRLTQQELAEMIGASRPVVSSILNTLRERRIVSYTRAFICIERMSTLRNLRDASC